MNKEIAIVSDTTSDISMELREYLKIPVAEAFVHFGSETFSESNLSLEEFHKKVDMTSKKTFPTTSQPSAPDLFKLYEKAKKDGYKSILSIHLSAKLSGTINSANIAKDMIEGIDIHIVDTNCVSATLIACLIRARRLVDSGLDVVSIAEDIRNFGRKQRGLFSLETIDNLVRSGRMTPFKYRLGKLLKIKPILKVEDGVIGPYAKTRGIDKSREMVYKIALENFSKEQKFKYIIAHSQRPDLAQSYEERLKSEFPNATGEITEIGIAIGVHTGRGAFFMMAYEDH